MSNEIHNLAWLEIRGLRDEAERSLSYWSCNPSASRREFASNVREYYTESIKVYSYILEKLSQK